MKGFTDKEGRVLSVDIDKNLTLVSVYVPNGGKSEEAYKEKLKFYKLLTAHIKTLEKNKKTVILGGGNLFRGTTFVKELGIKRTTADYVGILGTMQNSLVIRDFLELSGLKTIMSVPFFYTANFRIIYTNATKEKIRGRLDCNFWSPNWCPILYIRYCNNTKSFGNRS